MKGQKSIILFMAAVFSLVGILAVVAYNFFRNKPSEIFGKFNPNILGETSKSNISPTPLFDINRVLQNAIADTKEITQQKTVEVQKTIMTAVEKEISSLAKSQTDALKLQICREWGVVAPVPSPSP